MLAFFVSLKAELNIRLAKKTGEKRKAVAVR
jgi:hypothetical protein